MNAKNEFVKHVENKEVKCAWINFGCDWDDDFLSLNLELPINYSNEQFEEFLNKLNFEYDNGYGTQYLQGTIWYTDGTWSDRGEYDGSEWWQHQSVPNIPDSLYC